LHHRGVVGLRIGQFRERLGLGNEQLGNERLGARFQPPVRQVALPTTATASRSRSR
jgi:hypothetical protein